MKSAIECPLCRRSTETSARPGKKATCQHCREAFRVPLRQASMREFACPACGELTSSSAAPGRKTRCQRCEAQVRVPLDVRAADEPPEAPSEPTGPTVTRACPECGERVPGSIRRCPECRTDIDEAIHQDRYGDVEGSPTVQGMIGFYGFTGGAVACLVAVAWFVAGLAEGTIYFYPPVLFVFGLGAIVNAFAQRSRA